jgi:hypothetical protein
LCDKIKLILLCSLLCDKIKLNLFGCFGAFFLGGKNDHKKLIFVVLFWYVYVRRTKMSTKN